MFQFTLMMAKKVCFSRFWFFLKSWMNKGRMHFFGNCCSVYVYVWMCVCACVLLIWQRCGSVLLDFDFSTFRGPRTGKSEPFEVLFCSSLIRTTGRNKPHAFLFLGFFFSFRSPGFKLVLNEIERAGDRFIVKRRIICNQNLEPTPQVVNAIQSKLFVSLVVPQIMQLDICMLYPAYNIQSWKHCKTLPCGQTKKKSEWNMLQNIDYRKNNSLQETFMVVV